MSEKIVSTLFSAFVGGAVGVCVVFFLPSKTKFDTLEVGKLTITTQATLLNAEGKDDVVIKEGSVLANNVILGKKFIGTQYQGHVFVGNRMFTSPDDLVGTPMEQWKFFTEIGSSKEMGGEMIVRSPNGANIVGQPVNSGVLLRTGFDQGDNPQIFARVNQNNMTLPVPFLRPQQADAPKTEGSEANTNTDVSSATTPFPANAAAPAPVTVPTSVAENPAEIKK
jgi:hypothetical protein